MVGKEKLRYLGEMADDLVGFLWMVVCELRV